jgi:hypothetical protein
MKEMKTYKIDYCFEGNGTDIVKASNKQEAEEKFNDGIWEESPEEEWTSKDILEIGEV